MQSVYILTRDLAVLGKQAQSLQLLPALIEHFQRLAPRCLLAIVSILRFDGMILRMASAVAAPRRLQIIVRDIPGAESGALTTTIDVKNPKPPNEPAPMGPAKARDDSDVYLAAEGLGAGGRDEEKSEQDGRDRHMRRQI